MRVALVCPYDLAVPGGVQAHVRELGERLAEAGDEVLVIAAGRDVADAGYGKSPRVVGVGRSIGVPFNRSVAPVSLSPAAAVRVRALVRGFTPDVVHVHEPVVPAVSLAATAMARAPLVATFHAWSSSQRAYRLARPLLRPLVGRIDARIAVSEPAARYHAAALGLTPDDFAIVPNGVEVARFAAAEPVEELASDAPTLLFVGRLEPRKGLEVLLRACGRLRREGHALRLVVVGDGPERARCARLADSAIGDAVRFVGTVSPHELPRFHASADLFVAPSLGGESFGIVLVEAMAAGLPVVASAIPGYAAVLEGTGAGVLVPPGDDAALARALAGFLADASARSAHGRAGQQAATRYDWKQVTAAVREVYAHARSVP